MDSVSVVVPVFNSSDTLALLVERNGLALQAVASKYEIILVNDGSRDGTWDEIVRLANENDVVRGIDLMRNFGQHNALLCGIREARYEVIVTMDDDLQNPPEEIPRLLETLEGEQFDVVYGYPEKQQHGGLRDLASLVTKLALQKGMGVEAARYVSAFRAFRSQIREAFVSYDNAFVSLDVLLTWGTTRFGVVRVRHEARHVGESGYTVNKLVTHALNMLTGFTTWPLRIATTVGFGFTAFGISVLAFVIGRYLIIGTSVPGFPFLASIIAIFSGLNFSRWGSSENTSGECLRATRDARRA